VAISYQDSPGPRPTDLFGGKNDVNLLLYLANTYVFENSGWQLPDCPPLVASLELTVSLHYLRSTLARRKTPTTVI